MVDAEGTGELHRWWVKCCCYQNTLKGREADSRAPFCACASSICCDDFVWKVIPGWIKDEFDDTVEFGMSKRNPVGKNGCSLEFLPINISVVPAEEQFTVWMTVRLLWTVSVDRYASLCFGAVCLCALWPLSFAFQLSCASHLVNLSPNSNSSWAAVVKLVRWTRPSLRLEALALVCSFPWAEFIVSCERATTRSELVLGLPFTSPAFSSI